MDIVLTVYAWNDRNKYILDFDYVNVISVYIYLFISDGVAEQF